MKNNIKPYNINETNIFNNQVNRIRSLPQESFIKL